MNEIDYSGLFDKPTKPTQATLEKSNINSPIKEKPQISPVEPIIEAIEIKPLIDEHERAEADHRKTLDIIRAYQSNIKTSSKMQNEIMQGLSAGEGIYSLFLKAMKAISLMTDNELLYNQAKNDIIAIYGEGLLEKPPLEQELKATQERLERLQEAEKREASIDETQRIKRAIEAHKRRAEQIQSLIEKV